MAQLLPNNFGFTSEQNIATYDYVDLQEGTGSVDYYLANLYDKDGAIYALTGNDGLNSFSKGTSVQGGHVNFPEETLTEYDFDLAPFNLPKTIKGTAYINLHLAMSSSAENDANITMAAFLYKYDGSTETLIVSGSSQAVTEDVGAGTEVLATIAFPLTIANEIKFKKGEQLRLTLSSTPAGGSGTQNYNIGTDPANRAYGSISPSNSKIIIPYLLDI